MCQLQIGITTAMNNWVKAGLPKHRRKRWLLNKQSKRSPEVKMKKNKCHYGTF